jgi:hypothetical protein
MKNKTMKSVSATVIAADEKGSLPTKIKVLPYGEWNTYWYGMVVMTKEIAEQMVAYFSRGVRKGVPIDVDHDGGKAAGWVEQLTAEEDGLYADIDWTSYGKELLTEKIYRLFSPEWSFDWVDPQTSTHQGPVFLAGTLTNRPLLKELPLLASEKGAESRAQQVDLTKNNEIMLLLGEEQIMTVQEILAKKAADRTEEEKAFLTEHVAELSEEQKAQLQAETDASDEGANDDSANEDTSTDGEGAGEGGDSDAEDAGASDEGAGAGEEGEGEGSGEGSEDIQANEDKPVTIKASELKAFQAAQAELVKAQETVKRNEVSKEVDGLIKGNDGMTRILPAQKDAVVDFLMSADQKTADAFRTIVNGLPGVKLAGEIGKDSQDEGSVATKYQTIMASYKKAGHSTEKALDLMEKEHPELYKQAQKELAK